MVASRLEVHPEFCRDCQSCMLVCSLYHDAESNLGLSRVQVRKDMANYEFNLIVCLHCDPPECLLSCPADAIRLNEQGVAVLYFDDCIQCGTCKEACPHDAILYYQPADRYLKCDLCQGRLEGPACSQICPVGAIVVC